VHLLQIWIIPDVPGLTPGYWQQGIPVESTHGRWCLLVSPDGAEGSLQIRQEVRIYAAILDGATLNHQLGIGRRAYLHVARGSLVANEFELSAGDALAFVDEAAVELSAAENAEVLLFDL
jgi:redox-sensitive bicupin YhaK (pirin superfamily)